MTHKGIVGTTILMGLGWTVFLLGVVGLFLDPLVGVLLALAGAVQVSGGMITETINRKQDASEALPNNSESEMPSIDL